MLNISFKSVTPYINKSEFTSYQTIERRSNSKGVIKVLLVILFVFVGTMFLPWTQNIRSNGYVTTLNPYDKPQNIQALVGGKIQSWYVKEGDVVSVGDTIVILTEAKEEYLDPELLLNTKEQQIAKSKSADAYLVKRKYLIEQISALTENRDSKLRQLSIKGDQINLDILTTKIDLEAAQIKVENATNQLDRMQVMFDQGIKSLTDLEARKLAFREATAYQTSIENKLNKHENEKKDLIQEIDVVKTLYEQNVAKTEAEIQSTDSYRYDILGETNKLQSKFNQIEQRQNAFVITSPVHGRITKVLKNGIGEFVKAQDDIATIVPTDFQKAVELYIEPNDMPLIKEGKKVRIQFDGWPAVVFSGWPNNSFGTFGGQVVAIDNDISMNGKYRVLVVESEPHKPWPKLIRIGSGARGLLLLNEVKIYYELWRQLNGFPPDFYTDQKMEDVKTKAPIRKVK
jgi:multidrug efflux pump subunit AcrA (membrane-fusion protein)